MFVGPLLLLPHLNICLVRIPVTVACAATPKPPSDEVLWSNLPMRRTERIARGLCMGAIFVALLLLYLPLTAAIQVGCWQ